MEKLVLVGYGGHARSVEDSIQSSGKYEIIGYTDIKQSLDTDLSYLGADEVLEDYYRSGIRLACIAIGNIGTESDRSSNSKVEELYHELRRIGYELPAIIDPTAVIAQHVTIGDGTYIGKHAVVNAYSEIGLCCIINTGAIVEHQNRIGDYTHIAVGSKLCGQVQVSDHCMVGAGATVIQGVTIHSGGLVGAGSVVLEHVPEKTVVVGVPARPYKPLREE